MKIYSIAGTPHEVKNALKLVCAYRTSLMINNPRSELEPIWNCAISLFSGWIGFHVERREPSKKFIKIYQHGRIRLIKCLREIDEEMSAEL